MGMLKKDFNMRAILISIQLLCSFFIIEAQSSKSLSDSFNINTIVKLHMMSKFDFIPLNATQLKSFIDHPLSIQRLVSDLCYSQFDFYLIPNQPLITYEDSSLHKTLYIAMPQKLDKTYHDYIIAIDKQSKNIYCLLGNECESEYLLFLKEFNPFPKKCAECKTKRNALKNYNCLSFKSMDFGKLVKEYYRL